MSEQAAVRLTQVGAACALFVLWQLAATVWGVNRLLLPPPVPVLQAFWQLIVSGACLPDLQVTLFELAISFLIAAVAGSVVGYVVSRSDYAIAVFDPLFASLYSIPTILLFPLYVIYFGLGTGSKIAMGTSIAFFPIVLSTVAGLQYVDRAFVRAANAMGASRWQMFLSVMVPAAFPVLLTGLRLGFILAFLAILGAETIASLAGLGHRIVTLAEALDTTQMFAYILLVILVAVVLNTIVTLIEGRGQWAPA